VLILLSLAACGDDEPSDTDADSTQDTGAADAGADSAVDDTSTEDVAADDTAGDDTAEVDVVVVTSLRDDVFPIIQSKCGGCHTRGTPVEDWEESVERGTYFDEVGDMLARVGDDPRQNSIIAGDSGASAFLGVLRQEFTFGDNDLVMPPEQSGSLATRAEDIEIIIAWIDEGALDN
jgi:hypothetical protein